MGSKVSAVFFVLTSLVVTAPAVLAFETEESEYRQTVLKLENLSQRDLTATISKEIKHNDHTARVLLDSKQKSLLIIHHKSIDKSELETVISNLGISVKAIAQYNYQSTNKPLFSIHLDNSRAIRNCGATKTAWKRLLRKYFH